MSKITKLEVEDKIIVVELEIPYVEVEHLLELVRIHQDYKKERDTLCIMCESLKNYLVKGLRHALYIQRKNMTHKEKVDNWVYGNK